jgi:SAM-dependent methyltransferase
MTILPLELPRPAETAASLPSSWFESTDCLACGGNSSTHVLDAEDDLTGRPGRFRFVRCTACGLVFQSPRLTLTHVASYYDDQYIAHQERGRWGPIAPLVARAFGAVDRAKLRLVRRYVALDARTAVLDVGCGAGGFLRTVRDATGAGVSGVDFVDLSARPDLRAVDFRHGVFSEQRFGRQRFDLVTMWHFLEHDYEPRRSLELARDLLSPEGRLVIEVPRLDSLSFRLFGRRWPGVQAPQHTALFDKAALLGLVDRAGFEVADYLPYGAFPPYFYLSCGIAFRLRPGRGLNLRTAAAAYFAGQLIVFPVLPILKHLNFAMQTVVCRRRR